MVKKRIDTKTIIGLTEKITLIGENSKRTIMAKIDTGATRSSIDKKLAKDLNLGPITKYTFVRQASGREKRPVIKTKIKFKQKEFKTTFNLADRKSLKYKVLIGQNLLKKGFLIDPNKK